MTKIFFFILMTTGLYAQLISGSGTTIGTSINVPNSPYSLVPAGVVNDIPSGGNIGLPGATVDARSAFIVTQVTASQTLTLPVPTVPTGARIVSVTASSTSVSFTMYGTTLSPGKSMMVVWDGAAWSVAGASATLSFLFQPTTAYNAGDLITQGGFLYSRTSTGTSGASWIADASAWTQVLASGTTTTMTAGGGGALILASTNGSITNIFIDPASAYTTCSVTLPNQTNAIDGVKVTLSFGTVIAVDSIICPTLAIAGGGTTTISSPLTPTSAYSGDSFTYVYSAASTSWKRVF